jgi:anaerobic ribonucleoside-triphosphate reductase activating protein
MENGEVWDVRDIAKLILRDPETEGITISGGEPFLQAEALRELVGTVRSRRDYGVIIYTGFTFRELKEHRDAAWDGLLDCCDILVDGPYVEELNDEKSLRGSSNQTVVPLTGRYGKCLEMYGADRRSVEFISKKGGGTRMVGIPPKGIVEKFLRGAEEEQ